MLIGTEALFHIQITMAINELKPQDMCCAALSRSRFPRGQNERFSVRYMACRHGNIIPHTNQYENQCIQAVKEYHY